jgi:hypothetical protein
MSETYTGRVFRSLQWIVYGVGDMLVIKFFEPCCIEDLLCNEDLMLSESTSSNGSDLASDVILFLTTETWIDLLEILWLVNSSF